LEGLEISELLVSELEKGIRVDSELYKKDLVKFERKLKRINHTVLGDEVKLIKKGIFDIKASCYVEEGIPFVRISNLKNCVIETSDIIYIPEDENEKNQNTFLIKDDIVLSKTANAAASIVDIPFCNVSQDTVAIKLKKNSTIKSHYAVIYLNTKYGLQQMQRWFTGNIQMHLNLEDCKNNLQIPIYSIQFQDQIKSLFEISIESRKKAKHIYHQAETLLLETLGLSNFEPSAEPVNVKGFKESFLSTGRLDAEYYQKKYDFLENHLDSFERKRIGDFIKYPVSSGITPKAGGDDYTDSESGIPFVRAVDLQNGEVSVNNFIYIKPEIHNGVLKRTQLKNGDVLFSIAGTVGRCALFNHQFEANINQAVSILRFDDSCIKRLYLIVFFNSEIGKEFVSKYSRQGLQTNLNLAEVADLRVPIIDYSIQEQIAALVEESFHLKKQSESLLETAKRAVEIAIEQDEDAAMRYIEEQSK
jgi:restriction endonuclease S subunit